MQAFLWKSNGYRCAVMLLSNVNSKQLKPTHVEPPGERDMHASHLEVTWHRRRNQGG